MSSRSFNSVQLLGNLTRDPELRYTPQGTAVCSFGLATNRSWMTESGERKEDVEFHRVVAWAKLAELCAQLLHKGRQVFVNGRLQTRQWTGQDGVVRSTTEVVIDEMIAVGDRRGEGAGTEGDYGADYGDMSQQSPAAYGNDYVDDFAAENQESQPEEKKAAAKSAPAPKKTASKKKADVSQDEADSDLPF